MTFRRLLAAALLLVCSQEGASAASKGVTPVFKFAQTAKSPTIVLDTAATGKSKVNGLRIYYSTGRRGLDNVLEPCELDSRLTRDGILLTDVRSRFDDLYVKVRAESSDGLVSGAEMYFRAWNLGWVYDDDAVTPSGVNTDFYPTEPEEYYGLSFKKQVELMPNSGIYAQFDAASDCFTKARLGGKAIFGAYVMNAREVVAKDGIQWWMGGSSLGASNHPAVKWANASVLSSLRSNVKAGQDIGFSTGEVMYKIGYVACLEQRPRTPEAATDMPVRFVEKKHPESVLTFDDSPRSVREADLEAVLTSGNHPRLFMNDSTLLALKVRIGTDRVVTRLHNCVMEQADGALSAKPLEFKYDLAGRRILEQSRAALLQLTSCAYAYRMTGDAKYLEHAVMQLDAVCGFPSWNADRHCLDMGEMATAVGICYDWLYAALPSDVKSRAEKALKQFSVYFTYDHPNFSPFYARTNWGQVCTTGPTVAALAIYETCPKEAEYVLDVCLKANLKDNNVIFAPEGNTGEGYGYWCYGAGYQAIMCFCLESALGIDIYRSIRGIDRTADYFVSLESPCGHTFNFSDSGYGMEPAVPLWYYAYKKGDTSLLYNEIRKLFAHGYYDSHNEVLRMLPALMPCASAMDCSEIAIRCSHVTVSRGANEILTARSGWSAFDGAGDCFVGLKGGSPSFSHGHMDMGSFVFDSQGVRWAWDPVRPSYAPVENALKKLGKSLWDVRQDSYRWKVNALNNRAHNTLTINGADQRVGASCRIVESFDDTTGYGGAVDITSAYEGEAQKVTRTVKIAGTGLYVTDTVTALPDKNAEIEWRIITRANVRKKDDCLELSLKGKHLTVTCDSPVEFCRFSLAKENDFDADLSSYTAAGFRATVPAGTTSVFVTRLR